MVMYSLKRAWYQFGLREDGGSGALPISSFMALRKMLVKSSHLSSPGG